MYGHLSQQGAGRRHTRRYQAQTNNKAMTVFRLRANELLPSPSENTTHAVYLDHFRITQRSSKTIGNDVGWGAEGVEHGWGEGGEDPKDECRLIFVSIRPKCVPNIKIIILQLNQDSIGTLYTTVHNFRERI